MDPSENEIREILEYTEGEAPEMTEIAAPAEEEATPVEALPAKSAAREKWQKFYDFTYDAGELFFRALIKIGKVIAYFFLYIIAAILRLFDRFKHRLARFFKRIGKFLASPFVRYHKALKMGGREVSRQKREKGAGAGFVAAMGFVKRILFGKRGLAVTIFNYGLPVISCIFLFNIVAYATNQTYALKLTVNGNFVGYIADETVFTDAERMLQERINYTGASTDVVTFSPTYEIDTVGYGSTLSTYQVTDRMLQLLDKQVDYGFGLYIGDAYYGTLFDQQRVESALDGLLEKYRTDNPKESVIFEKEIKFVPGLFLSESFVNEDSLLRLLTSNKTVASYYTAVDGDTPRSICSKTGMNIEELSRLNSGFSEATRVRAGDRFMINKDEPYLNVIITREEHYNEVIHFSTEYTQTNKRFEDDRLITTNGVNGDSAVVANVSYINGVEVGRSILSRVTLKAPVTRVIAIGTKERPEDAAEASSTEEGKFIWPVPRDGSYVSYGWYGYYNHTGVDFMCAKGSPIYAADGGTITTVDYSPYRYDADWSNGGYGNLVVITHDNGIQTWYAHCDSVADIFEGQRVLAGELIAYVGATGRTYGAHLHLEVHTSGGKVNPAPYLPEFEPRYYDPGAYM